MSRNYGETLAYWYLRLNGFFPLVDFVMHKSDNLTSNTDCDILAIRLPHVYERVGGTSLDWDRDHFEGMWGYDLDVQTIGLIVSVKGGTIKPREILLSDGNKAKVLSTFDHSELIYALERLGLFAPDEIAEHNLIEELLQRDKVQLPGTSKCVGKLLISEELREDVLHPYANITISEISDFIYRRFETYQNKYKARFFFPDDLIQFIAWKAKQ